MVWNYRVLKEVDSVLDASYRIVEVYYDEKTNKITGWTETSPLGDTIEELLSVLNMMTEAFDMPILMESGDETILKEVEE